MPASVALRAVTIVVVLTVPTLSIAALCGDVSGDGFVKTSDALATLRLAVRGGYDRRGDVMPRPGEEAGDGAIKAGDALETLRSAVEHRIPACRGANERRAVVSTAPYDFYSSAGIAVIDVETRTFDFRGGSLDGDAVIRAPDGLPVAVSRHNFNALQYMDIGDEDLPTIKACSLDDGTNPNPQDVLLFSESKGYVTPYSGKSLLVIGTQVLLDPAVDPPCNGLVTGGVDLSSFDSDGFPQMDQMVALGSELFVSLQLLDDAAGGLPPKENGVIAVIDTTTDTVTGSIPLSFANPFGETKGLPYDEFQQRIFVGGPGNITTFEDGGIEAIDPIAKESAGMVMTGADIGQNIFDFVVVGTDRAFAIVADNLSNSVVELAIGPVPAERRMKTLLSSTFLITDIEMTERGELWVAYRGEDKLDPPGIRIFDVATGAETTTTSRIVLGQAPFTLAFVE
jgi:DNA-binding beta-propeller fold protein YncE